MMHASRRMLETVGFIAALYAARRYYRNWGTTKGECRTQMPGDELVSAPVVQVTEAVWIESPPSDSWVSLLQLRHDADRRDLESTPLTVGDTLSLRPHGWMGLRDGLSLRVEAIVPERSIVLRAAGLPGVVWSFHLQPHWTAHTRLLARARIGLRHPFEVVAVELTRPAIALLLRKVLLDIKRRSERQSSVIAPVHCAS